MKMITKIAKFLGIRTCYHVSFEFITVRGTCSADTTLYISPWLTNGNFADVREYLGNIVKEHGSTETLTITSITKIRS